MYVDGVPSSDALSTRQETVELSKDLSFFFPRYIVMHRFRAQCPTQTYLMVTDEGKKKILEHLQCIEHVT